MIISIIIPTYKRKESLLRLLKSLEIELKHDFEVIVIEQEVNNGKVFKSFAKKIGIRLSYIFLSEASTPHAKNVGVKNAQGDSIVFLDDDVVVPAGFIAAYKKAFLTYPRRIIAGRVLTPGQPVNEKSLRVGRISYLGNFSDNFSSTIPQEVDTVIGCNAGWRKDIFSELGGFDEQFTGNAMREESDLCLRAKQQGYHIQFYPGVFVTHLRESSGGSRKAEGRFFWYYHFFSNEMYFLLKHRPLFLLPVIFFTHWEWFLRCMFGFGREVSFRSIMTPYVGVYDGIKKYKRFKERGKRV